MLIGVMNTIFMTSLSHESRQAFTSPLHVRSLAVKTSDQERIGSVIHSKTMNPKDSALNLLFSILFICLMKGHGSSLKCCYDILRNHSISYHLSEPPGDFCIPTWTEMAFVVVDELGNVDETKVAYLEPQKLILKGNVDERVKQVIYRRDCPRTGHAYTAECHDPCNAPTTTPAINTTQDRDNDIVYITITIIVIIVIVVIVIAVTVIYFRKYKCQASRYFWKPVPKNDTTLVLDTVTITRTINDNSK